MFAVTASVGRPFAQLNLRRNPFGEVDTAERAHLAEVDLADWGERLRRGRFVVQFLGERGRGKSTHLRALHACFPEQPYRHIEEGERVRELPQGAPLFLDELQRVPRRLRRALFARGTGLAIASHADHAREARRAGLEVVTVHPGRLLTPERLRAAMLRRLEWARRGPGPIPGLRLETARALIARHGDDVRACEGELYEVFQLLGDIRDV